VQQAKGHVVPRDGNGHEGSGFGTADGITVGRDRPLEIASPRVRKATVVQDAHLTRRVTGEMERFGGDPEVPQGLVHGVVLRGGQTKSVPGQRPRGRLGRVHGDAPLSHLRLAHAARTLGSRQRGRDALAQRVHVGAVQDARLLQRGAGRDQIPEFPREGPAYIGEAGPLGSSLSGEAVQHIRHMQEAPLGQPRPEMVEQQAQGLLRRTCPQQRIEGQLRLVFPSVGDSPPESLLRDGG
jgi:hypothetical protein